MPLPAKYGGKPVRTKPFPTVNDISGRAIGDAEIKEVLEVLKSGKLNRVYGDKVRSFEAKFAEFMGVKHAIASTSGTAAIHIALGAIGVSPGHDVITAPITDMGTIIPILFQGAIPLFADVTEDTFNIDPRYVEKRITNKTHAIVPVHLFGMPVDMDPIMEIAEKYGLYVIEDCAQAYLAEYKGKVVGTIGHMGCFSLQQSKHITAGDGGVTITNDDELARRAALFADKGWDRKRGREYVMLGLNYRMTELQGAVALAQLPKLKWIVEKRRKLAERLTEQIERLEGLNPLPRIRGVKPSYWQYPIRVELDRFKVTLDEFAEALKAEGIPCGAGYIGEPLYLKKPLKERKTFMKTSFPLANNPFYGRNVEYYEGLCPTAERVLKQLVVIPWNEFYTKDDVDDIAEALRKIVNYYTSHR